MEDNFKAGDFIDSDIQGNVNDDAYTSLASMRYCDIFGRADLVDFRLFNKTNFTQEQMHKLPQAIVEPNKNNATPLPDNIESIIAVRGTNTAIGIDKDCREELSFHQTLTPFQLANNI